MPYIKKDQRVELSYVTKHFKSLPLTAGELNYLVTCLVKNFVEQDGVLTYTRINAAVGALECAKLELYRRIASPYEDEKIRESGDVY